MDGGGISAADHGGKFDSKTANETASRNILAYGTGKWRIYEKRGAKQRSSAGNSTEDIELVKRGKVMGDSCRRKEKGGLRKGRGKIPLRARFKHFTKENKGLRSKRFNCEKTKTGPGRTGGARQR